MKYPKECPVFRNRLFNPKSTDPYAQLYPEFIVGTELDNCLFDIEAVRPDNNDWVAYDAADLIPLTKAARDMLAIAKARK